jgi:hypothetical protein
VGRYLEGIATLLIVVGLLAFQAPGNSAPEKPKPSASPDSDGKVPIKKVCYHDNPHQAFAHRQAYRNSAGELTGMEVTIYVDTCELRDLGAGPEDVKEFIRHEKGHADGWSHGEGDPKHNPAYYPQIKITGR